MQDASGSTVLSPEAFIERWRGSGAAEQANSQLFLGELCDLLGVPRPEPTRQDDAANAYVFEKGVTFNNGDGTTSFGRIDLYRRGCFVLESKQGSERKQAEEEALSKVVRKSKINRRAATGRPPSRFQLNAPPVSAADVTRCPSGNRAKCQRSNTPHRDTSIAPRSISEAA